MKENMTRENDLHNHLINHLKEEVLYLKNELLHKNQLIDKLTSVFNGCTNNYHNNHHTNVNKDDTLPACTERPGTNDDLIDNHRVTISPDDSLCANGIAYNNIEKDDVLYDNNTTWFTKSKSRQGNKRVNNANDNINSVEHPNKFSALFNDDDAVSENNRYGYECANDNFLSQQNGDTFNNRVRPHVITQDYPENNHICKPVRPGDSMYSESVKDGKVTVVFSTSTTKGIKVRDFNNCYKMGIARFRRFHGAKAKYMKHYVIPTLVDEKPKVVMIQCGGND